MKKLHLYLIPIFVIAIASLFLPFEIEVFDFKSGMPLDTLPTSEDLARYAVYGYENSLVYGSLGLIILCGTFTLIRKNKSTAIMGVSISFMNFIFSLFMVLVSEIRMNEEISWGLLQYTEPEIGIGLYILAFAATALTIVMSLHLALQLKNTSTDQPESQNGELIDDALN